jgi:hypothetical protein
MKNELRDFALSLAQAAESEIMPRFHFPAMGETVYAARGIGVLGNASRLRRKARVYSPGVTDSKVNAFTRAIIRASKRATTVIQP